MHNSFKIICMSPFATPYEDASDEKITKKAKTGPAKTRARILAAAHEVVARDGAQNATIRNIAKEAKVSPGLVIQHFETKALLILEIYHESNRPSGIDLQKYFDQFDCPIDLIMGMAEGHLRRNLKHAELTRQVLASSWTWTKKDEAAYVKRLTKMAGHMSNALMTKFYPDQEFLVVTATYTIISAYAGVLRRGLQQQWPVETYLNVMRPSLTVIMRGLEAQVEDAKIEAAKKTIAAE
ncbi:hypothetical protein MNBD_ALPHA06-1844 [hydrothermal vent metagenome]|uniref:HTH tetR-type domain-containing protein n=1 Tax=hydrothermal vent metagenome TaxID=652676 RepID=A0A3B0S9G0_9ZZZZ